MAELIKDICSCRVDYEHLGTGRGGGEQAAVFDDEVLGGGEGGQSRVDPYR